MGSDTSLSARISGSHLLRYCLAVVSLIAAATVCRSVSLWAGDRFDYIFLLPAVSFTAWYCGIGPSIVVVLLASFGVLYGFRPSPHPFPIPGMSGTLVTVRLPIEKHSEIEAVQTEDPSPQAAA